MTEKVCAVIVVFDHHKKYVNTIIEGLYLQKVAVVILVNNGDKKIDLIQNQYRTDLSIKIIESASNLGSAGGFKLGIQKALETNADFVWLFDEDNYATDGSLDELLFQWKKLSHKTGDQSKLMLLSYRPHVFKTINIQFIHNLLKLTPKQNGFIGFNVKNLINLIYKRLSIFLKTSKEKKFDYLIEQGNPVQLDAAPYGGLFFHVSIKEMDILPDENMVLYWDDIDFTNRFYRNNGSIFLIPNSKILDMDTDNTLQKRRNIFYHPIIDLSPSFKAYYYAKNIMRLEKEYFRNSMSMYLVNKYMMLSILFIMCLIRSKTKRFRLLLTAMKIK